jgi:hypothetical protein
MFKIALVITSIPRHHDGNVDADRRLLVPAGV